MSEEQMTVKEGDGLPDEEQEKEKRASLGGDLIIPVSGSIFALYYFTTIWNSPWTAQVSAFFIGAVLIFLSTIITIRIVRAVRAGEAHLNFDHLLAPIDFMGKRIALMALTIAYILGVQWGGFTITTFIFLSLAMLLLNSGKNKKLIFILSLTMALGGWALFIWAFETRFPSGPFENMMKGIL
ncbi:MAG: tripartite tricarboxylate transporter TctB family protein [Rhodospirillales bacterium]|jgi:hypothetical protein|nr:tripartite tricarboxylate transporter TctB family protein [Rhodospirillales bacterium]MBT4007461.1 tripartite tricarboxylate transporter TctB family protein [Rhodospirillales bacterium]MBT5075539.1 tripartite tricarboxylate transporter TctB family protein [Rhodospirillales bacterium]MBT5112488.1 tripartite tricarboxylate transporter TctB family protein [Rhodospirillales bacterium]MBT5673357.1 tripartite tricarboxylate transporter TctB family protein [Rhodospirillales bacterium]